MGAGALIANTTGDTNVGIGVRAMCSNTTACLNTTIGFESMSANTTGIANTAVGWAAMERATTGDENTAFGYNTGKCATTGDYNTSIGSSAGCQLTTGTNNTFLGHIAGRTGSPLTVTTASNNVVIGNNSVANAYIKVDWTVTSDERDKMNFKEIPHGLDFVNQMKPVSFVFKKSRDENIPHGDLKYGFKAQDILALEGDNPVIINNKQDDILKITNSHLFPILVKAIQELTETNKKLTSRIEELEKK